MNPRRGRLLLLSMVTASTGSLAAPPHLGPADARGTLERNLAEVRIGNLQGVLRVGFVSGVLLEDRQGKYLLARYRIQNTRPIPVEIRRENFLLRTASAEWISPEGISDRPPLGYLEGDPRGLLRPTRSSPLPVTLPGDRTREIFTVFRGDHSPESVDPLVLFGGEPFFLQRPLRASPAALTQEALAFAQDQKLDLARGLLREAARTSNSARLELGASLMRAAWRYRRADQPVSEDRILRLALPYAPNPAAAQARLAELRQRLGQSGKRQESYHRRRADRYRVEGEGR